MRTSALRPAFAASASVILFVLAVAIAFDGKAQVPLVTLSVTKIGSGLGRVISSPAGIDCTATCDGSFATGTVVTLTAGVVGAFSTFGGWGGACTGFSTCQVTMNAAKAVTVTFNLYLPTATVQVSKAGAGTGTVTSSPAGIDCGATCSGSFTVGNPTALTATADAGSAFSGWSGGGCSGTGTCQVYAYGFTAVTATFALATSPPRLGNISTRGLVFTGDDVMIGGFVIGGASPKKVLVRARGPSMIAAGVANAMANPQLTLVSGSTIIATNDDFGTAPNLAEIQATGKAPTNALEAAILVTLQPGAYTAVVSGVGGGTGVGIVEVFEVDRPDIPLVNISTRGQVQAGDNVMIGGFIIEGDAPKTVLVRARGPSMIPAGVLSALANPQLTLVSGQTVIASNDDFGTALNLTAVLATGQAPTNPLESAILITLQPGAYTAVVSGVGGGTGVGIVEVFAQ